MNIDTWFTLGFITVGLGATAWLGFSSGVFASWYRALKAMFKH